MFNDKHIFELNNKSIYLLISNNYNSKVFLKIIIFKRIL